MDGHDASLHAPRVICGRRTSACWRSHVEFREPFLDVAEGRYPEPIRNPGGFDRVLVWLLVRHVNPTRRVRTG